MKKYSSLPSAAVVIGALRANKQSTALWRAMQRKNVHAEQVVGWDALMRVWHLRI